jgi:hypothetical protein
LTETSLFTPRFDHNHNRLRLPISDDEYPAHVRHSSSLAAAINSDVCALMTPPFTTRGETDMHRVMVSCRDGQLP